MTTKQLTEQDERCCRIQHRCDSVIVHQTLCSTDSMHLATQQYHPLYIIVQLSNDYSILKKNCFLCSLVI